MARVLLIRHWPLSAGAPRLSLLKRAPSPGTESRETLYYRTSNAAGLMSPCKHLNPTETGGGRLGNCLISVPQSVMLGLSSAVSPINQPGFGFLARSMKQGGCAGCRRGTTAPLAKRFASGCCSTLVGGWGVSVEFWSSASCTKMRITVLLNEGFRTELALQ